jgi:threonine synthase
MADGIPQRILMHNHNPLTLGEGNTPLVKSAALGLDLAVSDLRFKLESSNPTGSFKDRFTVAEVCRMLLNKRKVCLATSSGNTGSSLAAYCARTGIAFHLFVNEQTPPEKLLQSQAYGARIYRVLGFGIEAAGTMRVFELLQKMADDRRFDLIVSGYRYCPESMDNLRVISTEIAGQLEGAPDHVFVPVGGGGLLTAIWRGFRELHEQGRIERVPKIHAVQPAGNPTVYEAFKRKQLDIRSVRSTTRISGLSVPFDIDASAALRAVYASGGSAFAPSDEQIWSAQQLLSTREGIYSEPAGSTSVAGVIEAVQSGCIRPHESVVCIITGHGFKDSSSVARMTEVRETHVVAPDDIPGLDLTDGERPAVLEQMPPPGVWPTA